MQGASSCEVQHMHRKGEDGVGDYGDTFSLVPTTSGFHTILTWLLNSICSFFLMFTDHVEAFVQGELLPRVGRHGKVYMFSPPGYDKDPLRVCVHCLINPICGM